MARPWVQSIFIALVFLTQSGSCAYGIYRGVRGLKLCILCLVIYILPMYYDCYAEKSRALANIIIRTGGIRPLLSLSLHDKKQLVSAGPDYFLVSGLAALTGAVSNEKDSRLRIPWD